MLPKIRQKQCETEKDRYEQTPCKVTYLYPYNLLQKDRPVELTPHFLRLYTCMRRQRAGDKNLCLHEGTEYRPIQFL